MNNQPWVLQKSQIHPTASSAGDEFGAGAKQCVAPLPLRLPDNRISRRPRNVIVGDVSKKSYSASTASAISEQTIAKIHLLARDQRLNAGTKGLQIQD